MYTDQRCDSHALPRNLLDTKNDFLMCQKTMIALKDDLNLRDIIDLEEYAKTLDDHWSKVSAHYLILEGEVDKKQTIFGLLWK